MNNKNNYKQKCHLLSTKYILGTMYGSSPILCYLILKTLPKEVDIIPFLEVRKIKM